MPTKSKKPLDRDDLEAFTEMMVNAAHNNVGLEVWCTFMEDVRKGVSVLAAIRYARREWDV